MLLVCGHDAGDCGPEGRGVVGFAEVGYLVDQDVVDEAWGELGCGPVDVDALGSGCWAGGAPAVSEVTDIYLYGFLADASCPRANAVSEPVASDFCVPVTHEGGSFVGLRCWEVEAAAL